MVKKHILLSLLMTCILFSCKKASKDEDVLPQQKSTTSRVTSEAYTLERDDYVWIANSGKGSIEQLANIRAYSNFNIQQSEVFAWTDNEVKLLLNAVLYNVHRKAVGSQVEVTYKVYDGMVKTVSRTITIIANDVVRCNNAPCNPVFTIQPSGYDSIVAANKGTLDQLDNMKRFKTFNVDARSDAYWTPQNIRKALNAILFNSYGKPAGSKFDVVYAAYDGYVVHNVTMIVEVSPDVAFDVIPYSTKAVNKTNATKTYVHYMPWFESKPVDGYWGSHWTMSNQNPEIIDATGKRQIAAHYYPLIGPYASSDPDLVEYHLLLMKLSGIDGVLIDWYGTYPVNDYAANLVNSNVLINKTKQAGIGFGIMYEDMTTEKVVQAGQASTAVDAASTDFNYMKNNYFSRSNYIKINNQNLLLTFSPRHIETGNEWQQILQNSNTNPLFLALWGQSGDLGSTGSGEYSWVSTRHNLDALRGFYQDKMPNLNFGLGSAYPGFRDFYQEGGWGNRHQDIAHNQTNTLSQTLALAKQYNLPHLQLVTWNDFGEGTMLEPTREFGYQFLATVQGFTGVGYNAQDLAYVTKLYQMRKKHKQNAVIQQKLNQVYYYMVSLKLDRAKALLDSIN